MITTALIFLFVKVPKYIWAGLIFLFVPNDKDN